MLKSPKISRMALISAVALGPLFTLFANKAATQDVVYASPHATFSPQPEYPEAARAAGVAGAVVVRVQIDPTGSVTEATAVSGSPLLTESALKTVRTWKFEPTLINGRAVSVTSTITLNFGSPANEAKTAPAPNPPATPSSALGSALRMGPGISPPSIISRVEPTFSQEARAARIQGAVTLEAIVHKDGSVEVVRVVRGLGYGLDENAKKALTQWKFKPGMKDGQPLDLLLSVQVNFNFAAGPPPAPAAPNVNPAPPAAAPFSGRVATDDPDKIVGALKWEIREEATGQVLAEGDGPVHLKDISVAENATPSGRQTPKRIRLTDQFVLEMAEFPVPNITGKSGFGLTARRTDTQTFSWEWFNVQDSKHAVKLQETGELGIDLKQVGTDWEITRTEFMTDVSLRISRMGIDPAGSPPYWRVKIFKGSTITWPSIANGKVTPN